MDIRGLYQYPEWSISGQLRDQVCRARAALEIHRRWPSQNYAYAEYTRGADFREDSVQSVVGQVNDTKAMDHEEFDLRY